MTMSGRYSDLHVQDCSCYVLLRFMYLVGRRCWIRLFVSALSVGPFFFNLLFLVTPLCFYSTKFFFFFLTFYDVVHVCLQNVDMNSSTLCIHS